MENAGVPIDSVKGSNTGVFIGGFLLDNYALQSHPENQKLVTSRSV